MGSEKVNSCRTQWPYMNDCTAWRNFNSTRLLKLETFEKETSQRRNDAAFGHTPPERSSTAVPPKESIHRRGLGESVSFSRAEGGTLPSPATNIPGTKKTLKLKALIFDANGDMQRPLEGEFSKIGICSRHSLQPRDLRKMDNTYSEQLPTILVREKAILVNLLHFKALIKADMAIMADTLGSNSYSSEFLQELSTNLKIQEGSYEFRALETILLTVIAALQAEQLELFARVTHTLERLDERVAEEELKALLLSRRGIDQFAIKVNAIRGVFIDILNNDEDLAGMYLTAKAAGRPNKISDHIEAELLFEHYLNLTDEISNATHQLSTNISATQAITNIVLDSRRNQLINYELKATLATVAISTGALVASLFGMNLTTNLEQTQGVFWAVTGTAIIIAVSFYVIAATRLKRLIAAGGFKKRNSL
ncbi:hypothetical protein SpCBS45565_g05293 [Spizellomyces sp. 'palustris']|nr:hypothetical protein SpCBS45565_g05293 [Spizellomyces sp. 'palustris']